MAKKLSKVKRTNLVMLVKEAAWAQGRDERARLYTQGLMLDCRGRSRHQVIW